jgi:hypothetical protein
MEELEKSQIRSAAMDALAGLRADYEEAVARVAAHVQEVTGDAVTTGHRNFLDSTFADLAEIEGKCGAYLRAMALVRQWMLPADPRRLGDLLKILPADVAQEITAGLMACGVLPA